MPLATERRKKKKKNQASLNIELGINLKKKIFFITYQLLLDTLILIQTFAEFLLLIYYKKKWLFLSSDVEHALLLSKLLTFFWLLQLKNFLKH